MPTLIDLAGLPACTEDLSGVSLGPVVRNPPVTGTGVGQKYAFSQFPRCNCTYATPMLNTKNGTCEANYINHWTAERQATGAANNHVCLFTASSEFEWMGYSVRSDGWRYTVWVAWNGAILKVLTSIVHAPASVSRVTPTQHCLMPPLGLVPTTIQSARGLTNFGIKNPAPR